MIVVDNDAPKVFVDLLGQREEDLPRFNGAPHGTIHQGPQREKCGVYWLFHALDERGRHSCRLEAWTRGDRVWRIGVFSRSFKFTWQRPLSGSRPYLVGVPA